MKIHLLIAFLALLAVGMVVFLFSSPKAAAPTPNELDATDIEIVEEVAEDVKTNDDDSEDSEFEEVEETVKEPVPPQTYTPPAPAPTPQPDPGPSLPYNVIVTYDGNRFSPEEITIVQGGTVRFVNLSPDVKMWVASANHPTHTRYPIKTDEDCAGSAFDQCEFVTQGGSWSFKFDRFGTWGYHNHMRAQDTASVKVMTKEDYLDSL